MSSVLAPRNTIYVSVVEAYFVLSSKLIEARSETKFSKIFANVTVQSDPTFCSR